MDNVNIYYNPIIAEAIRARGYLVRYLSLYSPDFSSIELLFNILKTWVPPVGSHWTAALVKQLG